MYNYDITRKAPVLSIDEAYRLNKIALMREIFEVQSVSHDSTAMESYITAWIDVNCPEAIVSEDNFGNIYVTKGVALTYPCIVSHMDTVHDIIPQKNYVVLNSNTEFFAINTATRSYTGIGGDDKCGIFCCLDNLLREEHIKLAFFVDEETGCQGSSYAEMGFFNDVSFVFQADRKGYHDVAANILGIEMFDADFYDNIKDILTEYDRDITDGGLTDVMQLAENGLDVCMANFSCGYYKPHTAAEYVVIDELILTSMLFRDLIKHLYSDGGTYPLKRNISRHTSRYSYLGYGTGGFDRMDAWDNHNLHQTRSGWSSTYGTASIDYDKCTKCGCKTIYDRDTGLNFCNNCLDYDYGRKYE